MWQYVALGDIWYEQYGIQMFSYGNRSMNQIGDYIAWLLHHIISNHASNTWNAYCLVTRTWIHCKVGSLTLPWDQEKEATKGGFLIHLTPL
jgi:hypothetical protein